MRSENNSMILTGLTFPMDPLGNSDHLTSTDNDNDEGHNSGNNSAGNVKKSNSAAYEMIILDADFEPTSLDVICARGKEAYNHTGNIRFRQLVADQLHNYQTSTSKMAKSQIVREIIESVRRASPKGGFVKKVNGKWYDVGERARREKTGQQIRDLLHTQYRSSTKAKARTRKRLRKSHSANSATRAATQAAIMGATSNLASHRSSLPARVVTLDSENNSAAAAAARSALALQHHFRHNSEPDLASLAARACNNNEELELGMIRESDRIGDLSLNMIRDDPGFSSMARIRETEPTLSSSGMNSMNMNRLMNFNMNMNSMGMNSMGMNASSSSSSSAMTAMGMNSFNSSNLNGNAMGQGWGSSLGDSIHNINDGLSSLQATSGLLQHAHQRQQLSDLSGLLQQQQNQSQPNNVASAAAFGGSSLNSSSSHGSSFLSSFGGNFDANNSSSSNNSAGMGMGMTGLNANSMAFQSSSFNPSTAAMSMASQSQGLGTMGSTMGTMGMGAMGHSAAATAAAMSMTSMGAMQSYASNNTRPQDSTFSDIFQRSGRMVRQVPQGNEDFDPFLLPVEETIFKEGCNEDESEKSFEECIDNIYGMDGHPKRV